MALRTLTDQASVDKFSSASARAVSGTILASGDYHLAAPAFPEFSPPEGATAFTATIVTTASSGASVVYTIQGWDPASQTWIDLLVSAAVVATGTVELTISAYATAATNTVAQKQLRETLRIKIVGTGTTLVYSIGGTFTA